MAKPNKMSTTSGKSSHPLTHKPVVISGSDKRRMVSEAAYYQAEHRGFAPGDELNDWVLAELGIDAKLMVQLE